nr:MULTISPECIES: hypothetical protein [Bradyrhizobium]
MVAVANGNEDAVPIRCFVYRDLHRADPDEMSESVVAIDDRSGTRFTDFSYNRPSVRSIICQSLDIDGDSLSIPKEKS